MRKLVLAATTAAGALIAQAAGAQELRIGFINTLSGGGALIGNHQVNGWKLGLEHQGWTKDGDKLGGVATKVSYGDDQFKPDQGLAEAEKMIKQQKVHIIAGIIWSNVLMTIVKPAVDAKIGLVVTNAGASPIAGPACDPLIISTSWNNDQTPEAMGAVMSKEPFKSIWLLAPNYQAGKDMLAGFERTYKGTGKIQDRTFFKVGETDYQADISKIRAAKPDAILIFAPGAMGVAFMKQWAASGAGKDIKLYTVFTMDWVTLGPIGDAAIGERHTNYWNVDLKFPANEKFVKEYEAKHKSKPSHFAAQAYDAAALIAAGVKAAGGKVDDTVALMKSMRKAKWESTRGPFEYNVNGMPIQNFYLREVVKGPDGKPMIRTVSTVFEKHKDSYWEKCPADKRH